MEGNPLDETRQIVRTIERLLGARDEFGVLLQLSAAHLRTLLVAIREGLEK